MEERRVFISIHAPTIFSVLFSMTTTGVELIIQPVSTGSLPCEEARVAGAELGGYSEAVKEVFQFSSWPAVSTQEAIGVCFATGFDHLPVVWFLSPSSLGGFNYLN